MTQTLTVDKWLYALLSTDATLLGAAPGGVHADAAPRGTAFPVVIFALQDAIDGMSFNGVRILTKATYEVKVVGAVGGYNAIDTAYGRVDALLHRASGSATGGYVYSCFRIEPFRYREDLDGVEYRHLGGLYEIQVQ